MTTSASLKFRRSSDDIRDAKARAACEGSERDRLVNQFQVL